MQSDTGHTCLYLRAHVSFRTSNLPFRCNLPSKSNCALPAELFLQLKYNYFLSQVTFKSLRSLKTLG